MRAAVRGLYRVYGGPEWVAVLGSLVDALNTLPQLRQEVLDLVSGWRPLPARHTYVHGLFVHLIGEFQDFIVQRYGGPAGRLDLALRKLFAEYTAFVRYEARVAVCNAGHIFLSFARRGRVPKFCPLHRAARERDRIREYRRKDGQAPRAR
ncbi:MAG: hypothetical protein QN142_00860 [Armatimonadota bacterium]|nr:hypothetical protein [Armatimonadota bacterium]MDR7410345.1 hypothetical protein [Armatimonadota bacterium]